MINGLFKLPLTFLMTMLKNNHAHKPSALNALPSEKISDNPNS